MNIGVDTRGIRRQGKIARGIITRHAGTTLAGDYSKNYSSTSAASSFADGGMIDITLY